uniref:nitrile hydratase n=1 Tax=Mucochytrium quahogii TaxID=96639 RepID=A0A7S2S6K6_9STRA|mmetsp:Transcript_25519/g.55304  ORF Transcript_25519/g.55304 Transcript_25519/m.55304 type:complete len:437 (+) Transcript_25519:33-1343(+)
MIRLGQHDVGGDKSCYESLNLVDSPKEFWEKQVHCLLAILATKKLINVDELRRGVENLPEPVYLSSCYYGKWARSMLAICLERGTLCDADVKDYICPSEDEKSIGFEANHYVRVRKEDFVTMWEKPHLRTPGYLFGLVGQVERRVGEFDDPSLKAFRKRGSKQALYRVRFRMIDVWDDYQGSEKDTVDVEIYQPWLLPAALEEYNAQQGKKKQKSCHSHHGHSHGDHVHEQRGVVEENAVKAQGKETADERLARGFINALVAKGIISAEELRSAVEASETSGSVLNGARLIVHCWRDPEFKARALLDANSACEELGLHGSNPHASTKLVLVEDRPGVHNLLVCTLCSCYPTGLLGPSPGWYKSRSYRSRAVREPRAVLKEFGTILDENTRIQVHDSTADCRYMVLPMPPVDIDTHTEEQLLAMITRDILIGTKMLN